MYEWLEEELLGVRTPGFHVVDGPAPDDFRREVLNARLPIPPSYREFIFRAHAEKNNFRALGREIKVRTPFGERRLDVALQNREPLEIGGVELKSSAREFARLRTEQFAGDRWINRYGARLSGGARAKPA